MHNSTHRSPAQVADAVKKAKPDVLITWVSLPSLYDDLRVLDNIKYAAPNVLITVLGAVSNVMPEEILKRERVDIAVRGNYPRYNLILNLVQTLSNNLPNNRSFDMIGGEVYRSGDRIIYAESEPCDEDLNHLSLDLYYKIPVWKIKHDPFYRKFFIRSLPRKVRDRCMFLIHGTLNS
jgi:hypothetical protein